MISTQLKKSLRTGVIAFVLILGGFIYIDSFQSEVDEVPKFLRSVLEVNHSIWKSFPGSHHLAPTFPAPPKGKPPRFNGDLGLEDELENVKDYRIKIEQPGKSIDISIADLQALPLAQDSTEIKCIEGWSEPVHFAGPKFSDLIQTLHMGQKPDGSYYSYVGLETPDEEYYVSLDIDSMLHPQTILALQMNEVPLSIEQGYPVRLFIPIKYGIKSLKRIGRVFFSDVRPRDYWAERGYDWYAGL